MGMVTENKNKKREKKTKTTCYLFSLQCISTIPSFFFLFFSLISASFRFLPFLVFLFVLSQFCLFFSPLSYPSDFVSLKFRISLPLPFLSFPFPSSLSSTFTHLLTLSSSLPLFSLSLLLLPF